MNYLTICQRVHDTVGFQGQFTSVLTGGYQAVITQAVKDSYEDIQRYRKEWQWLKNHRDVNVSDLKSEYTLEELWGAGFTQDLASYRYINWYDTSGPTVRKFRLIPVEYDNFILMTFSEPHEPRLYSVRPWDKALLISPVDANYTLDLHYVQTLDQLVNNTDEPQIPLRHQQAIIYGAIMKVSTYTGDPTLYDTYSVKYAEELGQLMREENPARSVTKRPIA